MFGGVCLARHAPWFRFRHDGSTRAIAIEYAELFSIDRVQLDGRFARDFIEAPGAARHGTGVVLRASTRPVMSMSGYSALGSSADGRY